MIKPILKSLTTSFLILLFALNSFGRSVATDKAQTPTMHPKIDKLKVPKKVTETFYTEYPATTFVGTIIQPLILQMIGTTMTLTGTQIILKTM